jgi:hypothetical protein
MVWAINRSRRIRPRSPQLHTLTGADAEGLRHGAAYLGGPQTFTFRCPGPCSTLHEIRPRQRPRHFDSRTQRFRCPDCGIELQLSILAEVMPPRLSSEAAADYEAELLRDVADRPPDTLPTGEQAAEIRRHHRAE